MIDKIKKIAAHHDNVVRMTVREKNLFKQVDNFKSKIERDILYLKSFRNRIADLNINNCDRIIDLEIFFLKLFIPILSISLAAGVKIFGIDTHTLKFLSLEIIFLDIILLVVTFLLRTKIVASEEKRYEQESNLIKKQITDRADDLSASAEQLRKDATQALENEQDLQ